MTHSEQFIHLQDDKILRFKKTGQNQTIDLQPKVGQLQDNLENMKTMVDRKLNENKSLVHTHTAKKVSEDLLGQTQTHMYTRVTDQFLKSKKLIVNQTTLQKTHLQTRESMAKLDIHAIQEVEHHTIRPVKMDYAKQAVQQMPKLDDKPASRPMQSMEIDMDKTSPPVEDVMTYKPPVSEAPVMDKVDVDAIFEQIYNKFEKRIAFEKRRRGL